jgi:molecular chaperone Hsp33
MAHARGGLAEGGDFTPTIDSIGLISSILILTPMPEYQPHDRILRATGTTLPMRWVLLDATAAAQSIADQHGAQGFARGLLGETLSAALLLASRLKGPGTLQLRLKLTGDISLCAADATPLGLVRARIPADELQKTGSFEPMVLPRLIEVRKLAADGSSVSESLVEMTDVDVSTSLSFYLVQSEQVEAHLRVGSLVSPDGKTVLFCGGFLAETFPDADMTTRRALREKVDALQNLARFWVASGAKPAPGGPGESSRIALGLGLNLDALFEALHDGVDAQIHQTFEVTPFCPCSKDGVFKALASLARSELQALAEEEIEAELHCDFCRKRYVATREEILALIEAGAGSEDDEAGLHSGESEEDEPDSGEPR